MLNDLVDTIWLPHDRNQRFYVHQADDTYVYGNLYEDGLLITANLCMTIAHLKAGFQQLERPLRHG